LLRKTMLKTRDLFDVFSPVYSKHSSFDDDDVRKQAKEHTINWGDGSKRQFELSLPSGEARDMRQIRRRAKLDDTNDEDDGTATIAAAAAAKTEDLWKTLRRFLDDGYTLLGDFQDLDHAHIRYTPEQLSQYQRQLWEWNADFLSFVEDRGDRLRAYLSLPCKVDRHVSSRDVSCRHVHSHSSHLFWGNVTNREDLPDGNLDMATEALWRLGRSQLARAEMYLTKAVSYDHVISKTVEGQQEAAAFVGEEGDGVHEIYHNLRKELRSFVDELDLFGYWILPNSALIPEILNDGNDHDNDGGTAIDVSSDHKEKVDAAISSLKRARKLLGDMNDDYVAYFAYVEWDEYPEEQTRLEERVEAQWSYFRGWAEDVDLVAQIQWMRDEMDPPKDDEMHGERRFHFSIDALFTRD